MYDATVRGVKRQMTCKKWEIFSLSGRGPNMWVTGSSNIKKRLVKPIFCNSVQYQYIKHQYPFIYVAFICIFIQIIFSGKDFNVNKDDLDSALKPPPEDIDYVLKERDGNEVLKSPFCPLRENLDYIYRVEFQHRGSPHIHVAFTVQHGEVISNERIDIE